MAFKTPDFPNRSIPHRLGSLEQFLGEETGIDHDSVLAYLSDGTRLRSDNVRELAGNKEQVCTGALSYILYTYNTPQL